ncbi:mandelate racemase/muconate lactonizing enzyme family protein [Thermodesulfobacteriota bacterium]
MIITNAEVWSVEMELSESYNIAYEKVDKAVNIFLRLETNSGIIGYGCAAPDEKVTGETPDKVLKVIKEIIIPSIMKKDPLRAAMLLELIKKNLKGHPSALAALDLSLYDILGKTCNMPVWRLLGGFRKNIKTSITIGILPEKETLERARSWIKKGFRCLKLKGGLDVDSDIDRLRKLREVVGFDVEIRFDANQGFSVFDSIKFFEETRNSQIELIEQPTRRDEYDKLKRVTKGVNIPVMADESLVTLRDAFRIARYELCDMVNIKLMKVGGISEAIQINAVAKSAGLEAMVGCMDESALGIAAGLHFALSRPNVIYADLDGHLSLVDDPFKDSVILKKGILYPTEKPGLGI